MILCIDIGNTNIKFAIYEGDKLTASFRVASKRSSTADEYGVLVRDLFSAAGLDSKNLQGIIMSSVIPQLNYTIVHMCEDYFGLKPLIVEAGLKTGINVKVDNPREVGADRIVNSVAAYKKYGGKVPVICIDFGTATTINVITEKGELIGGVIAPGIKSSLDSLVNGTAKLPNIELELPKNVICKDTITNMQAGLLYGFAGLVEYLVAKTKKELKNENAVVVATGGLGAIIAEEAACIDYADRTLTLEGLKILYDLNKNDQKN
ncbi:MAG: type III pantothenate kinase [Candidatus Borkfalkiaceae bacterium]|nr:type III pantothenate kinase [Christensenellaceae bacterium]